LKGSFQSELLF